ncbi:MAG: dihydrodipicolinate synthase family protein [Trueperaceae bacterium]
MSGVHGPAGRSQGVLLPTDDGRLERHVVGSPKPFTRPASALRSRTLYAAVHVVADPLADNMSRAVLDWEATMEYRRYLWSWGVGVAEAMDTAQRGMGLDYQATRELIARSSAEARSVGGALVCGASTDQLAAGEVCSLDRVAAAYNEQCRHIEEHGGRVVLMASRHLALAASGPSDYRRVYDRVLSEVDGPVIIHWLGEMFDPVLAGYWGSSDIESAMDACLQLIGDHAAKIDGVKLSLLDRQRESDMRRRLPAGVRMYTGDDFNYDELILGDGASHSDALLGIFDAIAPAASAAVAALDSGSEHDYREALSPTVPLARHIFSAPTYYYKTGLVFLAYLNGHQRHFRMVGGLESARSVTHLAELFRLADRAGLLSDPESAAARMRDYLKLAGIAE